MPSPSRTILLALALAATGLTPVAQAATTKPAAAPCKIIVDDTGDTKVMGNVAHQDESMDILSADLASNAKEMTAVIRVKKWAATDQFAPLGRVFYFLWSAKGAPGEVFLSAGAYPNGNEFVYGFLDTSVTPNRLTGLGTAKGVFDADRNEIRVTAPLADLAKAKLGSYKKGEKLASLKAEARSFTGQNLVSRPSQLPPQVPFVRGLVHVVDDATATKSYYVGGPSCVAVGK